MTPGDDGQRDPCAACGAQLRSTVRFCPTCGAATPAQPAPAPIGEPDTPATAPRRLAVKRGVTLALIGSAAAAAVVVVVIIAGGGADAPDRSPLAGVTAEFVQSCGQCHALHHANTKPAQAFRSPAGIAANVGPDLDQLRPTAALTQDAIKNGRDRGAGRMPAAIVIPAEAVRIARYVAQVAEPPPPVAAPTVRGDLSGLQIFGDGNGSSTPCAACHTLGAAQATATTGPDLDKVLRRRSASDIRRSILRPDERISAGYQGGIMPQNYGDELTAGELDRLVAFLLQSTRAATNP